MNKGITKRVSFADRQENERTVVPENHSGTPGLRFHRALKAPCSVESEKNVQYAEKGITFGDLPELIGSEKFRRLSSLLGSELADDLSESESTEPPTEFAEIIDDDTVDSLSLRPDFNHYMHRLESEAGESSGKRSNCIQCLHEDGEFNPLLCSHSSLRFAEDISDREKKLKKTKSMNIQGHMYHFLLSLFNRK
ncbi:hypothetical protein FGB62_191g04 [Gracilaria domingensis]|nr:hypothetical protein FGB62_191g04 [Gracilaria domingensis]